MRTATISGRIAFAPNYMAENNGKPAFTTAIVGINMGKKDEKTGYYEEEKMTIKAWNYMAVRLSEFAQGDYCVVQGKLAKGQDYTNKDGELVQGQWEIHVEFIDNFGSNSQKGSKNETKAETKPQTQQQAPVQNPANNIQRPVTGNKPQANRPIAPIPQGRGGVPKPGAARR